MTVAVALRYCPSMLASVRKDAAPASPCWRSPFIVCENGFVVQVCPSMERVGKSDVDEVLEADSTPVSCVAKFCALFDVVDLLLSLSGVRGRFAIRKYTH